MSPDTPLTDDELGAMLGRSVRTRVDDVPTITPSFDGVERRARQITTRRRAAAVFGDDEDGLENDVVTEPDPVDETTGEDPVPDASDEEENGIEEPDVVDDPVLPIGTDDYTLTAVLGDTQFIGVDAAAGTETVLLDVGPAGEQFVDVVMLVDGSILAGVIDGSGLGDETVRHYTSPEAEPVVLSAHGRMNGGAVIDGIPVAFVTDFATEPFGTGSLRVVDLRTYESIVVLEDGSGPESVVVSVDVRGDLLLIEQSSEGGPTWFFRNLDGTMVGLDPLFPGGGSDAVWAFSPRFDRRGGGLIWLELDTATDEWALVSGGLDGIATDRFPLDLGPGAAEAFFTLEVTDGLMVANRTHGVWESSFETTTVWIEPNVVSNGVVLEYGFSRETEAGVVKYIEPAESSDAAGSAVDPEPSEPLADWWIPNGSGS